MTIRNLDKLLNPKSVAFLGATCQEKPDIYAQASPLTHAQPADPALVRLESVGLPTHNTEQKIVDIETGERELPVGEDGEIIIRGPQIMRGYWKAPVETANSLRNGWLYTGDIGHVDHRDTDRWRLE